MKTAGLSLLRDSLPPGEPAGRRLLLLTEHFPPGIAVGAQRWRRFIEIFAQHGWSFDVVTTVRATAGEQGRAELAQLPSATRVWGIPPVISAARKAEDFVYRVVRGVRPSVRREGASSPTRLRPEVLPARQVGWHLGSARGWLRLWFTVRDYAGFAAWARRVAAAAQTLADPGVHRAIVVSGPPHCWHEGGRRAAAATGLPLVLDLRDPWAERELVHEYFATPAWQRLAERRERRAIEGAAVVSVTTGTLCAALAYRYPAVAGKLVTVMNGYDDDPVPESRLEPPFTIGYAGSIYAGRDPRPLFHGTAMVTRELGLAPRDLRIRLIGDVARYAGARVADLAAQAGIGEFVEVGGSVSRLRAQEFMASSHMLVSLPWQDRLTLPAKLFEYMRYQAWVLAYAEPGSAIEALLAGRDADVVRSNDAVATARAIRRRYQQYCEGQCAAPLSSDPRLSRSAQAAALLEALDGLPGGGATRLPSGRVTPVGSHLSAERS